MKSKKISYTYIKGIIIIIVFLILIYAVATNIVFATETNFTDIYAQVGKTMYEDPQKVNKEKEGIYFNMPYGYKLLKGEGIFIENRYATIEVVPKKLNISDLGEAYTINPDEEILFEISNVKEDSEESDTNMIVWDIGNMYEVLLIDKNGRVVVGDMIKDYAYQGINDMAIVLNSIKTE